MFHLEENIPTLNIYHPLQDPRSFLAGTPQESVPRDWVWGLHHTAWPVCPQGPDPEREGGEKGEGQSWEGEHEQIPSPTCEENS